MADAAYNRVIRMNGTAFIIVTRVAIHYSGIQFSTIPKLFTLLENGQFGGNLVILSCMSFSIDYAELFCA